MADGNNPILNNPYEEPKRHYATRMNGKLDYEDIRDGRRIFVPVSQSAIPSRAGDQKDVFDVNEEGLKFESHLINRLRNLVREWRVAGYPYITKVSRDLLNHWFIRYENEPRKNLFFAQREALETAIFLNEAAHKSNPGTNILEELSRNHKSVDPVNVSNHLPRIAFKMATGTGKTVVMAGLIIYHYLNRQNDKSNTNFADYFLIVAPSITIRDRLQVLFVDQKSDNLVKRDDYYAERNLVPRKYSKFLGGLNARIKLTNYHAFILKNLQGNKRSIYDGKLDADGNKTTESETPTQMVKRIMGDAKFGRRLLVLNDEAHHCYLPKQNRSRKTTSDFDHDENEKAALWFTGLTYISKRYKLSQVYDLSATPYYLNGSGYEAYSLFPWVVSDFGLVESIESGLVKIPFLPEKDDTHQIEQPVLRNIYEHVKDKVKNRGYKKRKKKKLSGKELENERPVVPELVKNALDQLLSEYKDHFLGYRKIQEDSPNLLSAPPVMIIVCNNTRFSRDVFKYLAGYEIRDEEGGLQRIVEGHHELFSNYDEQQQRHKKRPPTILIDSAALDDAGQINDQFKNVFDQEIQEFKRDYASQHGQGNVAHLTDADILREVVNTVGKNGKLGSHVRCVVSVSMLTEGWDANNVTHIMGVRAFQSQLLCEQVAGRALRRMNYEPRGYDKEGNPTKDKRKIAEYRFPPEYATIIGVPFDFFKGGEQPTPEPSESVQVRALPEREDEHEIKFPILEGYRREFASKKLTYDFSNVEYYEIEGGKTPTKTTIASAFSEEERELEPEKLLELREQQIIYELTNELMQIYFRDDGQMAMFGKLKEIVKYWYNNKLKLLNIPDQRYKRFVRYEDPKAVSEHIRRGINPHENKEEYLRPIFMNKYEKLGSTRYAHGLTTREVYPTEKSHLNYAVADSEWEQIFAKTCEEVDLVKSYVKNDFLGFNIPYNKDGVERMYRPDFILKVENTKGVKANVIIEISGYSNDKDEKKWYTNYNWLPAVNSVREKYDYDPWYFYEIANDIRDVKNHLIAIIEDLKPEPEIELVEIEQ